MSFVLSMHFAYFFQIYFLVHDRYMTGKLLLKLDTVKFVVAHHTVIQLIFFLLFFVPSSHICI